MKYHFACIIINILIVNLCNGEIKFIQAVIRHGDRNPISGEVVNYFWPNDLHKNCDWEPNGPMKLTNIGKMSAYELGKFFRLRYSDLFEEAYTNDFVHFEAARMTRSINSAQLIAAGLYPPVHHQTWNPELEWTPVPIHSTPITEDTTFFAMAMCENYKTDRTNSESDVMKLLSMLSDVNEFFNYLSLHTGTNHTRTTQSYVLYQQLASKASLGIPLEPWTIGIFPDGKLRDISAIEYVLQSFTSRMKRLVGGVWIKKFLNCTEKVQSNEGLPRGFFHVGSEIQLAAILNALGVYEAHVPSYSDAIIFEMHEINGEYFVKVVYRNEEKLTELSIPGCESICLLSKFKDLLKNVTLENFEEDCGKRTKFEIFGIKDILEFSTFK